MERLKTVSLFCGCGGMDLGFTGGFQFLNKWYKKNNFKIIHASDYDKYPVAIYNGNFDHNAEVKNVLEVSPGDFPDHDVLIGGFPCQSFSIVAQNPRRLGYDDERGKLFFEMCKILKEKQPKAFVAENVKGLLSANDKQAFPLILENFKSQGYNLKYKVLNSADFGIPQKRERVFIIGFKSKDDYNKFNFPKPFLESENHIPLSSVLHSEKYVTDKYYFSERAVKGMKKAKKNMNKGRAQNISEPCNTVTSHLAKVSLNSTDPVLKPNGRYRRFTPTEVKRIQSFPESFELVGSDTRIYKALGNAVPPVLMWHVTRSLQNVLMRSYQKEKLKCLVSIM
jgi:DNA (cytosine-5)-methyltransferase 1